jgi:GDP-4-dehydro-6-deoxy-D-mannose reductase
MKVLVTGANGFVGRHLSAFLAREHAEVEVVGVRRLNRATVPPAAGVRFVEADLEDPEVVEAILGQERPDRIVHLAAQSSVHRSWSDPAGTLRVNVHGVLNLMEGLRRHCLTPRVLVVGSAEEYGCVAPHELPLGEDAPLRPSSAYAVSKVAQSYLSLQYFLANGIPVVRTRTFPHTGPGRGEAFAESSFARQIAEAALGRRPPSVSTGNLEAVRDYSDVRDVVRAYWALLERGVPGEVYNVCSGRGVTMREILDLLVAQSGLSVSIEMDPERLRPSDVPALVGDPTRLRTATAWEPEISLERTMKDLLDDWMQTLRDPVAVIRTVRV